MVVALSSLRGVGAIGRNMYGDRAFTTCAAPGYDILEINTRLISRDTFPKLLAGSRRIYTSGHPWQSRVSCTDDIPLRGRRIAARSHLCFPLMPAVFSTDGENAGWNVVDVGTEFECTARAKNLCQRSLIFIGGGSVIIGDA